jgi:small GTP-binding protein
VRDEFSHDYQTTIGVDFSLKRVTAQGLDINVQLWDIAGQERFSGLSRIFYTHAVAAVICYDLFDKASLMSAAKWKKDIDSKVFLPSNEPIPVLLLGNKVFTMKMRDDDQDSVIK